MAKQGEGIKVIARNRKARHDYDILETLEAGVVLTGSEIKSIRAGKVNLQDGFVQYKEGEMWLMNVHIAIYEQAGTWGHHDPKRPRKLLMHRKQIAEWISRVQEKRYTMIPIQVHLLRGRAKIEIALARGKRAYDKRESIKERDSQRDMQRALRERDY